MSAPSPQTKVWALAAMILCLALGCGASKPQAPHLVTFDEERIAVLVKKAGITGDQWLHVGRNGSGSAVIVTLVDPVTHRAIAVRARTGGRVEVVRGPSRFMALDDRGEVIASFDSLRDGVRFSNGEVVAIAPHGTFSVAPGGEYFLVEVRAGVTEIRRTATPSAAIASAPVRGEKLFEKGGKLYLFSRSLQGTPGTGNLVENGIECRVFQVTTEGAKAEDTIFIARPTARSSPFGVVDVDPWSDRVLLADLRDPPFSFMSSWYLFDLGTRKMSRLKRMSGFAFFLSEDPLREEAER